MVDLEKVCERLEEVYPDCTPMIDETDEHGELLFVYYPVDDDKYPETLNGAYIHGAILEEVEDHRDDGHAAFTVSRD